MNPLPLSPTWGHKYWLAWSIFTFVTFIVPEVYALATNWTNTLSASVWSLEKFQSGQSVVQWTAFHFLFAGMLTVTSFWLLGHLTLGFWRS